LLVEIKSLDNEKGCFASNAYFADFFKISQTAVSNHINKLIKLGYLKEAGFDGRKRTLKAALKISLRQDTRKVEGSLEESFKHINTVSNTDNNTINIPQPLVEKNDNDLFHAIKESFEAKGEITDYPKEMKHVKLLCKKLEKKPMEYAQAVIETFYHLVETGNDFWKSQPFLPSVLNSLFDRVNVQVKKREQTNDVSWYEEYTKEKAI
jgi:DNA-binding Lrp family transcriptional regulator